MVAFALRDLGAGAAPLGLSGEVELGGEAEPGAETEAALAAGAGDAAEAGAGADAGDSGFGARVAGAEAAALGALASRGADALSECELAHQAAVTVAATTATPPATASRTRERPALLPGAVVMERPCVVLVVWATGATCV